MQERKWESIPLDSWKYQKIGQEEESAQEKRPAQSSKPWQEGGLRKQVSGGEEYGGGSSSGCLNFSSEIGKGARLSAETECEEGGREGLE